MGKFLTKMGPRKVTHANFENILGNRCSKGLQGICDGVYHPYRVIDSDGKRISKTFMEITDSVKYDITNKLQHRKCVRRVQQINTYLEVQRTDTIQKRNLITILWI